MNVTYYDTPYGQLHVGIHTRKLDVNVDDERIDIAVEYGLDVNHGSDGRLPDRNEHKTESTGRGSNFRRVKQKG